MESEGPYTVLGMDDGFGVLDSRCKVVVAGEATVFENLENAEKCETLANSAYAAGRKAAEKDFKEAIGWADSICLDWNYSKDYKKWKKARGIE